MRNAIIWKDVPPHVNIHHLTSYSSFKHKFFLLPYYVFKITTAYSVVKLRMSQILIEFSLNLFRPEGSPDLALKSVASVSQTFFWYSESSLNLLYTSTIWSTPKSTENFEIHQVQSVLSQVKSIFSVLLNIIQSIPIKIRQ